MNPKAAFVAMAAASAFLLLTACGGGESDSNGVDTTTPPGSVSDGSSGSNAPGSPATTTPGSDSASNVGVVATFSPTVPAPIPGSVSGSWSTRRCSPLPQTRTFLGGALFVAEQGPVGLNLISDGGLSVSHNGFTFMYDYVFGIAHVSNPQDKWDYAQTFPLGTPIGSSMQVQLRPPSDFGLPQAFASTYPKGIPFQLSQRKETGTGSSESSTAGLGKDIPTHPHPFSSASVTYGPNNTATVTFFATTDDAGFSVGLTNVCGPGLRFPVYVPGVRDLAFDSASGQILAFKGAAGSGVYINPETGSLGATFAGIPEPNGSSTTTTAPDAEGRTFTLTPTTTPAVWTLSSSTGTSITLSDVLRGLAGTDTVIYGSLIRYGTRGLAFRLVLPWAGDYVYLVESPALIP
jgi:hypothetical protein